MNCGPGDVSIEAGGHRLRARWFTQRPARNQPVILLLHQGLGSVTQWRTFPEALASATGYAVAGYDRWGHGGSERLILPRNEDFLEYEARQVLPDVLAALTIERPVLYGHSDGGTIALSYAAAYPHGARAVITEAAHVFCETDILTGFAGVVAAYEQGDLRARLARHHGDNLESMFRGWVDFWRGAEKRGWRITEILSAIRSPLLVIQGADDDHGSLAQVAAIASRTGGDVETFIIPDCGHSPYLEATAALTARVAAFLNRVVSDG